jgi:hypothetical protein
MLMLALGGAVLCGVGMFALRSRFYGAVVGIGGGKRHHAHPSHGTYQGLYVFVISHYLLFVVLFWIH